MKNKTTEENKNPSEDVLENVLSVPTWLYNKNNTGSLHQEHVIQEKPVTLYLNESEIVTLLCTGHHLDELAVGFCYAEGFLQTRDDLKDIQLDEDAGKVMMFAKTSPAMTNKLWGKRTVTSGCGKGTVFFNALDALLARPVENSLKITPQEVVQRMSDLNTMSQKYRQTHGVHNTALATQKELLVFREDIGRHNAVDMIVGHAFLNNISLNDKLLITTGRLTSEIVIKTAKIGIPVIVSRNTATNLAIKIAESLGITLIGFARAGKFLVYTGHDAIVGTSPSPVK